MKLVYSNMSQVAELWAKQSQFGARCATTKARDGSGTLCHGFFRDKNIYSYGDHYLLGRLMVFNGIPVAAVNVTSWSNTTSGHSYEARSAARKAKHLVVTFSRDGINSRSTDSDIAEAILDTLKNESDCIYSDLEHASYQPYSGWLSTSIRKDVKVFNSKVTKLGLKHLCIDVPEYYYADVLKLGKLVEQARRSHETREQLILRFNSPGGDLTGRPCYRFRRTLQRNVS